MFTYTLGDVGSTFGMVYIPPSFDSDWIGVFSSLDSAFIGEERREEGLGERERDPKISGVKVFFVLPTTLQIAVNTNHHSHKTTFVHLSAHDSETKPAHFFQNPGLFFCPPDFLTFPPFRTPNTPRSSCVVATPTSSGCIPPFPIAD